MRLQRAVLRRHHSGVMRRMEFSHDCPCGIYSHRLEVSIIGYGGSALGAVFDANLDPEEGRRSVHEAFKLGINFFDTSPFYGIQEGELALGQALKDLPRSEIVVATKVGRYGLDEFDFSAERVTESIHESLERLQLDVIDLIQCHDIEFTNLDEIVDETIPALLKAKEAGLVKHIGITGLPLTIFSDVLENVEPYSVDTVLSYCHNTLFDQTLINRLPYFKRKGVGVIDASPNAMGLLVPSGPPDWHPAPEDVKTACKAARDLCKEHSVSLPRLALFTALQKKEISCTLVSMPTVAQVHENVETAKLECLSEQEQRCLEQVKRILEPVHNRTWLSGLPENN